MRLNLNGYKKNAIILNPDENVKGISKGGSKIGGKPDLPDGFEWYTYENKDGNTYPLSFVAQINLKEIQEYDKEKLLPKSGILYFFYELENMTGGFDPQDKDSAKVFYYDGDISQLVSTDLPKELSEEFCIPEIGLNIETRYELPFCEEYNELTGLYLDYDDYNKMVSKEKLLYPEKELHKLLGYADLIQGSMLVECEMVTKGIYCGSFEYLEQKEQFMNKAGDWQLLLQLDTISNADYELMFYDCGRIYFYIKKEDLKKKNFDNIWLISQSY